MKKNSDVRIAAKATPKLLAATMCAVFASGCAVAPSTGERSITETFASDDPCSNNARNIGIAVGALAGMVIGNQIKHSNTSRLLGAAAGAAVGGLIGADMDRRRCELFKIAQRNSLDMKFEEIKVSQQSGTAGLGGDTPAQTVGMKVLLKDNGRQFNSGTDELSPEAQAYFQQIADQYSYEIQRRRLPPSATKEEISAVEALKGKRILLVGHTDDTGSSSLNADLSERRARSVAKIFRDRGIHEEQLFFQGAGETLPVADNRTEEGRTRNRRVEIVDLTDDTALHAYLSSRKPVVSYYRTTLGRSPELAQHSASVPANVSASASAQKAAKKSAVPAAGAPFPTAIPSTATPVAKISGTSARTGENPATGHPVSSNPVATSTSAPSRKDETRTARLPAGWGGIDFGGEPAGARPAGVDIGKLPSSSGSFSLISAAQADEPLAASCAQDRPRISRGVKSLKDEKEIATRDYLPGLYDSSWAGTVNGHLVALTHVAVLRDGGVPARRPQLLVYRDYQGDTGAKPAYTVSPEVNTYQGEKGLLYRVFVNGAVQCMDVFIPNSKPTEATGSHLFYGRGSELYMAAFNPRLAR